MALDPKTGAILAMVSHPTYDPNPLSSHDLTEAAQGLEDADRPTRTSPTSTGPSPALYPPGSTFKVVTAAAALEDGVVSNENSDPCRARRSSTSR